MRAIIGCNTVLRYLIGSKSYQSPYCRASASNGILHTIQINLKKTILVQNRPKTLTHVAYPFLLLVSTRVATDWSARARYASARRDIFKKGDVQLFDNYRPISVLLIFGKIF